MGLCGSYVLVGFCPMGFCPMGFCPMGFCPMGFCPMSFCPTLVFPTPLSFGSFSAPSLPRFRLEFRAEVNHEETRVMGLSSSEDPMIVAGVVLTQCQRVTDRRTDGRVDDMQSQDCAFHYCIVRRAVKRLQVTRVSCSSSINYH